MYNLKRTIEVIGYDPEKRTAEQIKANPIRPRDIEVVDNCPSCGIERKIRLNQSRKNKPCSKCFHASPEMKEAKKNQNKVKSEETRQKMRENHWSTKGQESPFKGKKHTQEVKEVLKEKTRIYYEVTPKEIYGNRYVKGSCTQRGIALDEFDGFSAPEGTRIRQSGEGKAWTLDVLSKANFTCVKCSVRGGKLVAHHKNGFNAFPDQRFDVDNGACLCHDCHEDFHAKFGRGYNTLEQYTEFVNEKT